MSTYTKQIIIDNEGEERRVYQVERTFEDDSYTKSRDHLSKIAEAHANREYGIEPPNWQDRDDWCKNWNSCYFKKMDELAKERGI